MLPEDEDENEIIEIEEKDEEIVSIQKKSSILENWKRLRIERLRRAARQRAEEAAENQSPKSEGGPQMRI